MLSPVIILTLITMVYAATIERVYVKDEMSQRQLANEQMPVSGVQNNNSVQNNNPPPSLYTYPTYPEYSSNTGKVEVTTGYEGYLAPKTTAVQKSSRLPHESIFSSLIPFAANLVFYIARAGTYLLPLVIVILVGVSSSLVCTYTSICNSFTDKAKELAGVYMTPENLDMATAIVGRALDKYRLI